MTRPLFIKGGRIIDPAQGIDRVAGLLIADGRIAWLGEGEPPQSDYDVLDAGGLLVCPGFVDMHCHLRQPGDEQKETINTGTKAAARGGFTTVCCMPNTNPPLDSEETIRSVKAIAGREGYVRVLPIACITRGRKGEELVDMAELEAAGAVGFSDDGSPVGSPDIMRQALEASRDLGMPVIDHCENLFLSQEGQLNEGVVSLELGLRGIPAAAEENIVQRDLELARETGVRVHIAHVSTAGSVELIRAAKDAGIPVTAEVTPHHLTLTEEAALGYNTNAKVNPPLRTREDTRALLIALNEGVIDIVATDHAPHAAADKECDFTHAAFGISGFETAFASLLNLVYHSDLGLNTLITAMTVGPGRILGYDKLGTLETGGSADVAIIDLDKEWIVDPAKFASKGKNTPLAGQKLRGKVLGTLVGGHPMHLDKALKIEQKANGES